MTPSFVASFQPPRLKNLPTWYFAFRKRRMLLLTDRKELVIPDASAITRFGFPTDRSHYLGRYGDRHCYALALPDQAVAPDRTDFIPLRSLYGQLPDDVYPLCGRAIQVIEWDQTHRFCSCCGTPTRLSPHERAKECPQCGHLAFPRLAPAVIVLVERDDQVLLARSPRFPPGTYSVLAGFVEVGECLEEAVAREIFEEVSIRVKDLRYFGSQPWPFPHSLMVAFTAVYAGGDLRIDGHEIEDAAWYRVDRLPSLPGSISIARRLIDWFIAKHKKGVGHADP